MKKTLLLFFFLIGLYSSTYAGNEKSISKNDLPKKAQDFIEKYFPSTKISYAKVDDEWLDKTYEVIFVDGSKVEFNRNGEWKEVKCQYSLCPSIVASSKIQDFVKQKHKGEKIIEISRDKKDYEIKLKNGIKLKFDLQSNFIKYDY